MLHGNHNILLLMWKDKPLIYHDGLSNKIDSMIDSSALGPLYNYVINIMLFRKG